jgi:serine/threonine protein kinase
VDHYCIGALLYELVTGLPPFYSTNTDKIYQAVLGEELSFPDDIILSTDCKNLIYALLNKNHKLRLGN